MPSIVPLTHPGEQRGVVSPAARPRTSLDRHRAAQEELLRRLLTAKVAGPQHRAALTAVHKADIASVKVLGEGAFGIVDLVLVTTPGSENPLLCVRKKLLKQSESSHSDPAVEIGFLVACQGCPNIVQLLSHVMGLYDYTLLLEYCSHGSLDTLLSVVSEVRSRSSNACFTWLTDKLMGSRHAGLTEPEARFYTACCVLGLEALHLKGILHRDLKPANLLLADNKYVKLGDLGLGKQLGQMGKAYTHVGTPGYMAPEVLHSKDKSLGYSYPADLWSLGMVLWELVEGQLPRWAPMSWYWTSTIKCPDHFSPELKHLLTGLLHKAPKDRLQLSQVKQHAWFAGFDWDALQQETLSAPDYPELQMVHVHGHMMHQAQLQLLKDRRQGQGEAEADLFPAHLRRSHSLTQQRKSHELQLKQQLLQANVTQQRISGQYQHSEAPQEQQGQQQGQGRGQQQGTWVATAAVAHGKPPVAPARDSPARPPARTAGTWTQAATPQLGQTQPALSGSGRQAALAQVITDS